MSTKATDKCLKKAGDDEPIFVLRAQDKTAPLAVRAWAATAKLVGAGDDKVAEALKTADEMEAWQKANGRAKLPD